ncbi:MAG TPA: 3-isopropylmalate dehydratase small subunit [Acidimicrobiales bacterium]|nr:3-isopropylmalate dehydratase small subunit [Acidimicrobiales bacterium]
MIIEPITHITGTAAPLRRSDVDTDQIIPAEWLKRVERTGFGEGLFGAWRKDKSFVLNEERYRDAVILVAGPNFGTGSSREHAVWALTDFGFRAVVSPRFGDIFRNNATKAGLVPVQVDAEIGETLMAAVESDATIEVTVDVVERTLRVPSLGIDAPFPLDDFTRHRLVEGLDDIGLTLRHATDIDTFEARRPAYLPTTTA